jgi:hypothetical protein
VTNHKTQIDQRPFQSKSDHEREMALQTQYHNLAIPAVVAALQNRPDTTAETPSPNWTKTRGYRA